MANKNKRCRNCKEYKATESMQHLFGAYYCDIECMKNYGMKSVTKVKAKKHAADKERVKNNDKPYRDRQAQASFNKFIRFRDDALPCISCGRHHTGQYHAGHYRSRGAHPELRFEELNCHKQCAPCNNHLSGNISNYRSALIERIGVEKVDWIEGPHEPRKYTCAELKEIELKYKRKLKELKGE